MFGPKMHVMEAPLAGAAIGGLIGGGGTIAGLATIGGLSGMAIGALLTKPLMSAFSPKMPKAQNQQSNANAETPAMPGSSAMPAVPNTPAATPEVTAGDASAPTTEELARGELERKRRGRLSTILTSPKSRLDQGVDEGFERLGG